VCYRGEVEPMAKNNRSHSPVPMVHADFDNDFQEANYTQSVRMQPVNIFPYQSSQQIYQRPVSIPMTIPSSPLPPPPAVIPTTMVKHMKTASIGGQYREQYTGNMQPPRALNLGNVAKRPEVMQKSLFESKLLGIGINPESAKTLMSRAKIRQYPATSQATGK